MVEHWLLRFATGTRSLATPTTVASGVGAVACKGKGCRAGFFFLGDNRWRLGFWRGAGEAKVLVQQKDQNGTHTFYDGRFCHTSVVFPLIVTRRGNPKLRHINNSMTSLPAAHVAGPVHSCNLPSSWWRAFSNSRVWVSWKPKKSRRRYHRKFDTWPHTGNTPLATHLHWGGKGPVALMVAAINASCSHGDLATLGLRVRPLAVRPLNGPPWAPQSRGAKLLSLFWPYTHHPSSSQAMPSSRLGWRVVGAKAPDSFELHSSDFEDDCDPHQVTKNTMKNTQFSDIWKSKNKSMILQTLMRFTMFHF